MHRLEVRLEDRLLHVLAALADEPAGVHVDGGERLGLVDDEVPAAGQRHLARKGARDLVLDAVRVEDRLVVVVVEDVLQTLGHEHLDEAASAVVLRSVVDDDLVDVVGEEVACGLEHDVELAQQRRRRLCALVLLGDLAPEANEIADVLLQLLLREPFGDRSHDEAAGGGLHALDGLAQARPLLVAADPLAHAHVLERRQVHDVSPRQRDVARAARALRADRLLGDLDDDLLPLFDDVADRRRLRQPPRNSAGTRAVIAVAVLTAAPTATATGALAPATLGAPAIAAATASPFVTARARRAVRRASAQAHEAWARPGR